MTVIDYYYFPLSPYCYLAGNRLEEVAGRHGATINYKPFELMRVFAETGTPPPKDRHKSRQIYRLKDIERSAAMTGMPVNLKPAHWPTNPVPASSAIIGAQNAGGGDVGGLCQNISRAVWVDERDIAEDQVVRDCLSDAGFDPDIADKGMLSAVETLQRNTEEALQGFVFGAPSYVISDEVFWGHDRLAYLDRYLADQA